MPIRITSNQTKIALMVAAGVVVFLLALTLGVLIGSGPTSMVLIVVVIATLVFFTRCFRGQGEETEPPRRPWRLTARPTSGYVVAAVFAVVAVALGIAQVTAQQPASGILSAFVYLMIALGFLLSSLRLSRTDAVGASGARGSQAATRR